MNKRRILLSIVLLTCFACNLSAADKKKPKPQKEQSGTGIVDRYKAHGKEVYRFVSTDKKLRMIKFVPGQLGYKRNKLPKKYEDILAKALAEKKTVFFKCKYVDHGPGKTAIGKKIIELKFADEKKEDDEDADDDDTDDSDNDK